MKDKTSHLMCIQPKVAVGMGAAPLGDLGYNEKPKQVDLAGNFLLFHLNLVN